VTLHDDANHHAQGAVWTNKRTGIKGKNAEVGKVGTLSQCMGGDEIFLYNAAGSRRYPCTVAWCYGDGQGAMVRMNDGQRSEDLKSISNPNARVEGRRGRPK